MSRPGRLAECLLLAAMTGGLLAGCATREKVSDVPMSPVERRAALEAVSTWEARGRIALKAPGASGQGSFTWTQAGDRTVLRVAGAFGADAREIRWDPARLTVLSSKGEVAADYAGPDAAAQSYAVRPLAGTSKLRRRSELPLVDDEADPSCRTLQDQLARQGKPALRPILGVADLPAILRQDCQKSAAVQGFDRG